MLRTEVAEEIKHFMPNAPPPPPSLAVFEVIKQMSERVRIVKVSAHFLICYKHVQQYAASIVAVFPYSQ